MLSAFISCTLANFVIWIFDAAMMANVAVVGVKGSSIALVSLVAGWGWQVLVA